MMVRMGRHAAASDDRGRMPEPVEPTPFQRFEEFTRQLVRVSKSDVDQKLKDRRKRHGTEPME